MKLDSGDSVRTLHTSPGEPTSNPILFEYAMPNFYFHLTMVYALLRFTGVELSKSDFDGYHQYETVSR